MEKKKVIISFVSIFGLVAIFLPGYSRYQGLIRKNTLLEERIKQLEFSNRSLEEEQKRLEEDMVYVEKVLRDKLKVVKKGEIIYKIEGGSKNPPRRTDKWQKR